LVLYRKAPRALSRKDLNAFAENVFEVVAHGQRFCCLVTNDEHLRQLNRDFRGKDAATDVLSFPSPSAIGSIGEIAISVQHATAQALVHGHDVTTEACILLLHGVLHLLGYDHETDSGRMRRAETRWRKSFGLPNGLIERSAKSK
jgi:probable rRNA maturation factor